MSDKLMPPTEGQRGYMLGFIDAMGWALLNQDAIRRWSEEVGGWDVTRLAMEAALEYEHKGDSLEQAAHVRDLALKPMARARRG